MVDAGQVESSLRTDATIQVNGDCLYSTGTKQLRDIRIDSADLVWKEPDGRVSTPKAFLHPQCAGRPCPVQAAGACSRTLARLKPVLSICTANNNPLHPCCAVLPKSEAGGRPQLFGQGQHLMPFTARLPRLPWEAWERIDRALTSLDACMQAVPELAQRIEDDPKYLAQLALALKDAMAAIEAAHLKNEVIDA